MFFNKSQSVFQSQAFGELRKVSRKRKTTATLMLTSLIDAFSILVVYLLMFFSNTAEMAYVSSDIELPKASVIERLDRYSIIQIKKDGYFVEDKELKINNLVPYLVDLKKKLNQNSDSKENKDQKETITIQADKTVKYNRLSAIIQACSHAGFSHIKFAVLGE